MTGLANRLVVFSRYPVPGHAKTRLIPALGPEGAATLQRQMTGHTVLAARIAAATTPGIQIELQYTGGSRRDMQSWLGAGLTYARQADGSLGERLHAALLRSRAEGTARTVITGTDCPRVTAAVIGKAFETLAECDVVLGPATDGGYYLIGLREPRAGLFTDMPWGTGEVLRRTLDAADRAGLSVARLSPLSDVDRPQDLVEWQAVGPPEPRAAHENRISVIDSPPGRAAQLNAAAAAARGEILLFLGADAKLPPDYQVHVRRMLAMPSVAAGAFRPCREGTEPAFQVTGRPGDTRSHIVPLPRTGRATFLYSVLFREYGGYAT